MNWGYFILSLALFLIAGYFVYLASNDGYKVAFTHGYGFIWFLIIGNIALFACECLGMAYGEEGESSNIYFNRILWGDGILLLGYFIILFSIRYYKTKKINDAIFYGIIGRGSNTIILVRKSNCVSPWSIYPNLGSQYYNNTQYTGLLNLYNNETHECIKSITENDLWEMLKLRKTYLLGRCTSKYHDYSILYPQRMYSTWYEYKEEVFKKIMKTEKCPYCGTPLSKIRYAYIRCPNSVDATIMIYNVCCEHTFENLDNIRVQIHKSAAQ